MSTSANEYWLQTMSAHTWASPFQGRDVIGDACSIGGTMISAGARAIAAAGRLIRSGGSNRLYWADVHSALGVTAERLQHQPYDGQHDEN